MTLDCHVVREKNNETTYFYIDMLLSTTRKRAYNIRCYMYRPFEKK